MPTPVSAARQCLTQEAAAVLDEAVAVARRRGHAQTTSLHMVSSLLSLPNSSLREACTRARNNAYSTRVQFKALELSLSVSLDRLPSSQANRVDEPPVSNSLMAAVKRSQANQRRQPENFTFYQQQQQYSSCSSVPVVKVELQNLVLSILDDPLVSRVFGEAGFRSCDIKIATIRPGKGFHPSHLFGYSSRYKRPTPPLFLCNLGSGGGGDVSGSNEVGGKGFSFPFMACFGGDENYSRRIGEVMLRDKKRNPILLGVSAIDALRSFLEMVQGKSKGESLPDGICGLSVVCVGDEVLSGDCGDEGALKLKLEEVERMVEKNDAGKGVVVDFGDLKGLAEDGVGIDELRCLVSKLAKLLEVGGKKLWLIGAAANYEVYYKILNKFPSIEEDWDLEVLPITSLKFPVGGSYPRSSLMESFVPLGGFFSMPPETKSPSSNYVARCHLCKEKYEQEVAQLSNGEGCASVTEKYQSSLPFWLQTAELGAQSGLSSMKGKDDRLLLNAKIMGLQKKWDSICQQHHFSQTFSRGYTHPFPRFQGFRVSEEGKERTSNNNSNESSNEQGNKNVSSSLSTDLQQTSLDMLAKNLPKSAEIPSQSKGESGGFKSHSMSVSVNDGHTSPTSVTSVSTTNLGLTINISAPTSREPDKPMENLCRTNADTSTRISNHSYQPPPFFYSEKNQIVKDPKSLYKALVQRIGRQEKAISAIVEAVTQCQKSNSHRNTWMNFRGPDRLAKKKLGLALAETLYGSTESLIYVDLNFPDEIALTDTIFNSWVTNKYDLTMRGTVLDFLVEKLSKKPSSLVFLENIDKADLVVQNSLCRAVKTGRFPDSFGREVNIGNSIFLGATARVSEGNNQRMPGGNDSVVYTEEDVLRAKGSSIQILIRFDLNDGPTSLDPLRPPGPTMNKRKLVESLEVTKRAHKALKSYLDLNLMPTEESERCDTLREESDCNLSSESSRSSSLSSTWLEDFEGQIDGTVVFEPFDFDMLAEKVLKGASECLRKVVGSDCSIEIEQKAMQQLLAAAYLHGNERVEDWIPRVLGEGFAEAMGKFSLDDRSVVRIVAYEEEQPHQDLLPARVTVK